MGFTNQIKVTAKLLNCRLEPSMSAKILGTIKMDEVHNIVTEQSGWGQLENGSWINLKFTTPLEVPEIFVTGTSTVEEQLESETITTVAASEPVLHKVKKRESLWDIAELYYGKGNGARYVKIKEFNNLKSDILRVGMTLKIPE